MKKTTLLGTMLVLFVTGLAGAAVYTQVYMPQNATVKPQSGLDIYVEGVKWTNNTDINWGQLDPSYTYLLNLTVINTGNTNQTIYLITQGLPTGWTETWTGNSTLLEPTENVQADIELTVPANAEAGTYSWQSWVRAEQS